MKRNLCILVVSMSFLRIGILSHAAEPEDTEEKQMCADNPMETFRYKTDGPSHLVIEVHSPRNLDKTGKPVPGIIMFHGGGWKGGRRSQFLDHCKYFASRGLVASTVTYRLGKGKDTCVKDAISAIRWFKENAKTLGVDPNRIITGGGSAGGHISLLATTNPELNPSDADQGPDTSVVAYLLFNPALRVDDDDEVNFEKHVTPDLAPSVVFFGDQDHTWLKGWDSAREKMKSLGIKNVDYQIAKGQTHAFFNRSPWKELTIIAADRFLNRLGLLGGEPSMEAPSSGEKLGKAGEL